MWIMCNTQTSDSTFDVPGSQNDISLQHRLSEQFRRSMLQNCPRWVAYLLLCGGYIDRELHLNSCLCSQLEVDLRIVDVLIDWFFKLRKHSQSRQVRFYQIRADTFTPNVRPSLWSVMSDAVDKSKETKIVAQPDSTDSNESHQRKTRDVM